MSDDVRNDELFQDNNTRALFFKVADALPAFVRELEMSAERGSKMAKKELETYKEMLSLLQKSELGQHF